MHCRCAAREADWAEFRARAAKINAESKAIREAATVADEARAEAEEKREEAEEKLEVALSNADAAAAHAYKQSLDADFEVARATFQRLEDAALARADRAEEAETTEKARADAAEKVCVHRSLPTLPVISRFNEPSQSVQYLKRRKTVLNVDFF